MLYYHQLFCLVFETKQFSLPILFFQFLNQHDPLCIHVLLTTVLNAQDSYEEQIILNLTTFHVYTHYCGMIVHKGTGAYQWVYSINLFQTYCQLSLQ